MRESSFCAVGEKTDRINGDKLRYGPIMDDVGVVGVGVVSRRNDVPREQEGWKVGSGGLGGLQLLPRTIRGGVAVARSTEVREVAAHCRRDSLERSRPRPVVPEWKEASVKWGSLCFASRP